MFFKNQIENTNRARNYKKNQTNILRLESTITEMKSL